MKWLIGIVIAIAGIAVVGLLVKFFRSLKKRQDELEERFQIRFTGKKIRFMDKHALYIARLSDGYSHFRGAGYLVLTENELYFERLLRKMIIDIPTHAISEVEITKRLAGQSPGKMLKVVFETQKGEQDAVAWKVKNLDQWVNEISNISKAASKAAD